MRCIAGHGLSCSAYISYTNSVAICFCIRRPPLNFEGKSVIVCGVFGRTARWGDQGRSLVGPLPGLCRFPYIYTPTSKKVTPSSYPLIAYQSISVDSLCVEFVE
jgi:hypothetical protein